MTVLLLGDSHLAYAFRDHRDLVESCLGADVACRAFGGAVVTDLYAQCHGLDLTGYEAVVLSIGTNDLFLGQDFRAPLEAFLAQHPGVPWLLVSSPNFDEGALPGIPTRSLLAPLGPAAYVGDGIHLSRAAYVVLLPSIGEACRRIRIRPR